MKKSLIIPMPVKYQREIGHLTRNEEAEIRKLVLEKLSRIMTLRRFRKARRLVRPYAIKAGIQTDEDVFRSFQRRG